MSGSNLTRSAVGVFSVVATYVLFLLWDQFGFLRHLEAVTNSDGIRFVMAAMGVSGLLASLTTGHLLGRRSESSVLRAGFGLAAVAAPASLWAEGLGWLALAAAALGVATGLVTVSLASGLRRWLLGPNLTVAVGIGTGLAYFVCNVPGLFEGSGMVQATFVSMLCGLAVAALTMYPLRDGAPERSSPEAAPPSPQPSPQGQVAKTGDATWTDLPWPELSLLLAFLALVWLDSAAFAVIQETLALKGATWATPAQTWLQGTSHLLAAIAAGFLLRRGYLRGVLLATYVLFGIAFQLLGLGGFGGAGTVLAGPIYAVGISLYSTALVVAPTLTSSRLPIRWRAAVLYGVAGWLGSALGVGMAQDLHRIPGLFLAAAGAVLVLGWMSTLPRARELLRVHAVTLLGVALAVLVFVVMPAVIPASRTEAVPQSLADAGNLSSLVEAGREVYIAEGCMGCHSQYVRPRHEQDERLYGPHRPLDRNDAPPLVGLRRQGPDLSNVGQRHDAAWLRRHLIDPRSDEAASAMPSYRRLFDSDVPARASEDGSPSDQPTRGDALVAYLQSLRPSASPSL